ncbi:non-ribosomal peptide synthetase [Moorena bouillonii]|uniref:Carrier domain-containing protein n=1 Tax=Moorena bouillonii PNG TaxID=568701 RepID=A0A1U7MWY2_9CYAN|nr:non-ribosomal peptide synthetase [Moorena bouillonii]OLT58218.1 hypothetical protein BJP37_03310 [Moorena bouillonii PNG]
MKTLEKFLDDLANQDIKLWLEGQRLRCNAPEGVLTSELRTKLSDRKQEIITFLQQANLKREFKEDLINPIERNGNPPPLSFAQQRLWFIEKMALSRNAYNMPLTLELVGKLDYVALEKSLNQIIARHETLRTTFSEINDTPLQIIQSPFELELPIQDLSELTPSEQTTKLQQLLQQENELSFNLEVDPPIRAQLFKLGKAEHILQIILHHIASDGWSLTVLPKELSVIYTAIVQDQPSPIPELPIQYADFAVWQRNYLQGETLESQLSYWRQKLQDLPQIQLPTDHPRPPVQTFNGAGIPINIPAELTSKVKQLSQKQGTTLFMTLLAAFKVLMSRYSGQESIAVGSPIANRNRREIEGLIGFFVNSLVMYTDLGGDPSFTEVLNRVKQTALEAYGNQDIPFEKLVEELQPERSLSQSPLFQVMFAVQQEEVLKPSFSLPNLEVGWYEGGGAEMTVRFDLELHLWPVGEEIKGFCAYNRDLFSAETISRMVSHYENLLSAAVETTEQPVSKLPLMKEAERDQILVEWNNTKTDYPNNKCIRQLFEEQVEKTPDAAAVVFEQQKLTYSELNSKANQLAHYLQKLGVVPDTLVGICVERSVEMVVGILAILKAGGAYVPLDPNYPSERLAYMISDSQVSILLTQQSLVTLLSEHEAQIVCLDSNDNLWSDCSQGNLSSEVKPSNLGYVIYTSGSTGKPKGVAMSQGSLVNLILWQQQETIVGQGAKTLQFAPISFDVSFQEIFSTCCSGGILVLVSSELRRDPLGLMEFLTHNQVERLFLPFVALQQLALVASQCQNLPPLREVITAGEQLQVTADLMEMMKRLPECRLQNQYGPSESHVVSAYTLEGDADNWPKLPPIGRPIANTQLYVLSGEQQPLPVGVPGELYIGGVGLANGYLNRLELTTEKFIPHPFDNSKVTKLYRTGDLCRYLADGNIEFLGRIDNQVKIRGYRVETGEIEATLTQHTIVKETVVLATEDNLGNKRLVAYIVLETQTLASSNQEISEAEQIKKLKQYLKEQFPEYMIPSGFVVLSQLPLTPSGKVDRKALPVPDNLSSVSTEYVAPETETQKALAEIWREVLGIEQIGIHDNFFDLGGHSMNATQVVSRVQQRLPVEFSISKLFQNPTIAQLAEVLVEQELEPKESQVIPRVSREQEIPLSYPQEFILGWRPLNGMYSFTVDGLLNLATLEQSFNEIIRRHESLRTTFPSIDGKLIQVISTVAKINLSVVELPSSAEQITKLEQLVRTEARKYFDLASPPLSVTLVRLSPETHVVILVIDHIIYDGWSINILISELYKLYEAYSQGNPSPLPELPIQYADYSHWQRQQTAEVLEEHLSYWRHKLAGTSSILPLLTDRRPPEVQSREGRFEKLELNQNLIQKLEQLGQELGTTLFTTMLSATFVLLYRYSGESDLIVGAITANRNRVEIEPLIGMFASILPIRSQFSDDSSFTELLTQVKQTTEDAYKHQDLQFPQLLEELIPGTEVKENRLMRVYFDFLNIKSLDSWDLPGLRVTPRVADYPDIASRMDLEIYLWKAQSGPEHEAYVCYNTDIFDGATIARLMEHFLTLLEAIVANPQEKISKLPLITTAEKQKILQEWNNSKIDYPTDKCIHQLFENVVEKNPNAVALIFEEQQLTYAQLNYKANQLAHHLLGLGISTETPVGIYIDPTLERIVGLLAILKAGGAYVAIDPTDKSQDLQSISVILTLNDLKSEIPDSNAQILCLDTEWESIATQNTENPNTATTATNLAYILNQTPARASCSPVEHQAVAQRLQWLQETLKITNQDILLHKTSLTQDVALLEIGLPLISGGSIVIAANDEPTELQKLIGQHKVTIVHLYPSELTTWLNTTNKAPFLNSWRSLLCSGETLSTEIANKFLQSYPVSLHNFYSLPEAGGEVTHWQWLEEPPRENVPVGNPGRLSVYVLDQHQDPVPTGVPGEIYIGGSSLARGYLHQQQQISQKFIEHPQLGKLFQTGDIGRYHNQGYLEIVGVKQRYTWFQGKRIELADIETALLSAPGVEQAYVLANQTFLVAYVVVAGAWNPKQLQSQIQQQLPPYMMPGAYFPVSSLPLTHEGKVDEVALAHFPITDNETERKIAQKRLRDSHVYISPLGEHSHEEESRVPKMALGQ